MTAPVDLEAIAARAAAATGGPWRVGPQNPSYVWADSTGDDVTDTVNCTEDATFIAHAREDVPALLDLVRRYDAMLDACEGHLDERRNARLLDSIGRLRAEVTP